MRLAFAAITVMLTAACQHGGQAALDRLHPCQIAEGPPDAYCGTYRVFENRAAASGRTIDLKIVVAPALRRDPKPDPLFVFEGGPGGGAATLASQRIPMFRRFQTDRDIVLIDQRGTGESNPLDCAADDRRRRPQQRRRLSGRSGSGRASRNCRPTRRFYTTSIAMDDIDDVRQFLGYDADQPVGRLVRHARRARVSEAARGVGPQRGPRRRRAARHAAAALHGARRPARARPAARRLRTGRGRLRDGLSGPAPDRCDALDSARREAARHLHAPAHRQAAVAHRLAAADRDDRVPVALLRRRSRHSCRSC